MGKVDRVARAWSWFLLPSLASFRLAAHSQSTTSNAGRQVNLVQQNFIIHKSVFCLIIITFTCGLTTKTVEAFKGETSTFFITTTTTPQVLPSSNSYLLVRYTVSLLDTHQLPAF